MRRIGCLDEEFHQECVHHLVSSANGHLDRKTKNSRRIQRMYALCKRCNNLRQLSLRQNAKLLLSPDSHITRAGIGAFAPPLFTGRLESNTWLFHLLSLRISPSYFNDSFQSQDAAVIVLSTDAARDLSTRLDELRHREAT